MSRGLPCLFISAMVKLNGGRGRTGEMAGDTAKKADAHVYEDYLRFADDLRCDILDGQIHDTTPRPTVKHQTLAGKIFRLVENHVETGGYPCRVFIALTDGFSTLKKKLT
jgi:hypothetical protein